VNAYELGLKSKWFDDTVLLNLDVFRSDYQGLQVTAVLFQPVSNVFAPVIRNAAVSRSQGVELETQWAATRNLRLSANITYLESFYVSFPNASPPILQQYCTTNYVLPYCSIYPKPVRILPISPVKPRHTRPRWSGSVTGQLQHAASR